MLLRLIALTLLAGINLSQAIAAPDGARLYGRNCASCHGEKGSGGIGIPLSLPSFQASISDEYLHKTIRLGRPGRIMPAFSNLNDAEVEAIVHHVRSWYRFLGRAICPSWPRRCTTRVSLRRQPMP